MLIAAPLCADKADIHGGGAELLQHGSVRLLSQRIYARIGWEDAHTQCRFVLKNFGPAVTIQASIPEESRGFQSPINTPKFKNLKVWIDGKLVSTHFTPGVRAPEHSGEEADPAQHLVKIHFAFRQTRVMKVEYTSPLGGYSMGWTFMYFVGGGNWDAARSTEVTFDVSRIAHYFSVSAYPDGYSTRNNRLTWKLRPSFRDDSVGVTLALKRTVSIENTSRRVWNPKTFIMGGTPMISADDLAEGMAVDWDEQMHQAIIRYRDHSLRLTPHSSRAILDGKTNIDLAAAPYIVEDSLAVPILDVARSFGFKITEDKHGNYNILEPGGTKR